MLLTKVTIIRRKAARKQHFKYLLYTLGIVERWYDESKAAIKDLEALTGRICENPYEYGEERWYIEALTEEELYEINKRLRR